MAASAHISPEAAILIPTLIADVGRLCSDLPMKNLLMFLSVGLVVASCSDPRAGSPDPDPGTAIALCLDEKLIDQKSEHTRIRYVSHDRGRMLSYVFDVFSGDFYSAEIDPPVPITNMVIAARLSPEYFEERRENPPKNRQGYDTLRQRFEAIDNLRMSDIAGGGALTFLEADLAAIEASATSILPRQPYLVRDGNWVYKIISDGPPDENLRAKVGKIVKGIDQHATSCEPGKKARTDSLADPVADNL